MVRSWRRCAPPAAPPAQPARPAAAASTAKDLRARVPEGERATFDAEGDRSYEGRFHAGAKPRLASAEEAAAIVAAVRGQRGEITGVAQQQRAGDARVRFVDRRGL